MLLRAATPPGKPETKRQTKNAALKDRAPKQGFYRGIRGKESNGKGGHGGALSGVSVRKGRIIRNKYLDFSPSAFQLTSPATAVIASGAKQ
jgi:hypothetical protein